MVHFAKMVILCSWFTFRPWSFAPLVHYSLVVFAGNGSLLNFGYPFYWFTLKVWSVRYMVHSPELVILYYGSLFNGGHMAFGSLNISL